MVCCLTSLAELMFQMKRCIQCVQQQYIDGVNLFLCLHYNIKNIVIDFVFRGRVSQLRLASSLTTQSRLALNSDPLGLTCLVLGLVCYHTQIFLKTGFCFEDRVLLCSQAGLELMGNLTASAFLSAGIRVCTPHLADIIFSDCFPTSFQGESLLIAEGCLFCFF